MAESLHPLDIIIRKRDGHVLSDAQIQAFIHAVVCSQPSAGATDRVPAQERITDAQIASFLMAVFQRGLSGGELAALTQAMRFSGKTLHAPPGTFTVDKHSTGGVGDKTSLLLAPIVAAAAAEGSAPGSPPPIAVPMISGRSLGHTGGTLDKLETIPGFNTQLSLETIAEQLLKTHAVLVGQTPDLVPADRVLYALRDHTGTVESPYLITASIMSKKLAEDLRGLVLDVKVGSGAFMPSYETSRELANLMVDTGTRAGTRTVALLTSMDEPLGRFAGNWLEVQECVEILQGRPHRLSSDLIELTLSLAGHMLHLADLPHAKTPESARLYAHNLLTSGKAYRAWLRIVEAQGGDTTTFNNPESHHPTASRVLIAGQDGYLAGMDCREVGWAVQRLGAGREKPGDPVSAHAGLEVHAKLGDKLSAGQPLCTLYAEDPDRLDEPFRMLQDTLRVSATRQNPPPLIYDTITAR